MAAVAGEPAAERSPWLACLEHELRVHAIVGADFAIPLDEWCDGQEEQFLGLVADASRRLARRGRVTAQEAAEWIVLDGKPIIWRGEEAVDIGSIVALADALAAIIGGTYPQARPVIVGTSASQAGFGRSEWPARKVLYMPAQARHASQDPQLDRSTRSGRLVRIGPLAHSDASS